MNIFKNTALSGKRLLFLFLTMILMALVIPAGSGCNAAEDIDRNTIINTQAGPQTDYKLFTNEVDGLHVTGTAIKVDMEEYRLKITGLVKEELDLTFDEVKSLPSVRIYSQLVCPGVFVDEGYWTGVRIIDLLNMAGLNEEARSIRCVDVEDSYDSNILIEKIRANQNGFLVAYEFDDKIFSEIHGFPLRIVAQEEPGNVWVKWLGKIEVLQ